MELTLKIAQFIFLLVVFSSSLGRRTRKRIRPTKLVPAISNKSLSINGRECSRIVDTFPDSSASAYYKSHKVRQLCIRLNETQLMNKLKNVGGFNPRYMAANKEDACRFQDLSENDQPSQSTFPRPKQDQPIDNEMDTEIVTNGVNEEIENLLNQNERRQKRMVSLPPGSIDRGCRGRGSIVDGTRLVRLCTECGVSTRLPASVFPPFINEVICGDSDGNCFGPIGKCVQKTIEFTFLRSTGKFERDDDLSDFLGVDVYVEEWDDFTQDIRACCECRMFAFLADRVRGR